MRDASMPQQLPDIRCCQIVRDMFNLSYIIINQHDLQSVDTFVPAILDDAHEFGEPADDSDDGLETVSRSLSPRTLCTLTYRTFRAARCTPRLPL